MMKIVAGSILTGLSLLAQVVNEWASHFFFAAFNLAKGMSLEGAGTFSPGPYTDPAAVQIFVGTRVIIWVLMAVGIGLMAWGIKEEK
ncbi:MAG: hypothetical protein R6U44_11390 [Archaeoglobaceae archaeon]